jgi:hypothetical protein
MYFFPAERDVDRSPTAASPRCIKVQPNIRRQPFEAGKLLVKPCGGEVPAASNTDDLAEAMPSASGADQHMRVISPLAGSAP